MTSPAGYVRFEASVPNARGTRPGVFALVNGLAARGQLSGEELRWWRDFCAAQLACPDPTTVAPDCYDRALHPAAAAWYRSDATTLIAAARGCCALLDAHGVGWLRACSADPGRILYADAVQVVAG